MLKYIIRPLVNSKSSYNGRFYAYPAIVDPDDNGSGSEADSDNPLG